MKILFLDVDGVLNSIQSVIMYNRKHKGTPKEEWRPYDDFCPISVSNLQFIMESCPDVNIVVSSTWRMGGLEKMQKILKDIANIDTSRVIDITPVMRGVQRGIEIQAWLDANATVPEGSILMPKLTVEEFVIVDDDSDMAHLTESKLVQTDNDLGLTLKNAREIIKRFGGNTDGW